MPPNKTIVNFKDAVADIPDGASVMIGGFGGAGGDFLPAVPEGLRGRCAGRKLQIAPLPGPDTQSKARRRMSAGLFVFGARNLVGGVDHIHRRQRKHHASGSSDHRWMARPRFPVRSKVARRRHLTSPPGDQLRSAARGLTRCGKNLLDLH